MPANNQSSLSDVKAVFDMVTAVFTVGAIIAGAWWFFMQRYDKPQVKLDQTVTQRALSGEGSTLLIAVDVRASNVGKVRVSLGDGRLDIGQINPVPGKDLVHIPLQNLVLEPGETDQALFKTFRVPADIKTIEVRSEYRVPNSQYFWNLQTATDIGATEPSARPSVKR